MERSLIMACQMFRHRLRAADDRKNAAPGAASADDIVALAMTVNQVEKSLSQNLSKGIAENNDNINKLAAAVDAFRARIQREQESSTGEPSEAEAILSTTLDKLWAEICAVTKVQAVLADQKPRPAKSAPGLFMLARNSTTEI